MAMSVMLAALRETLIEHMAGHTYPVPRPTPECPAPADPATEARAELKNVLHAMIDVKVKETILRSPADKLSKQKILFLALGPAAMIDDIELVSDDGD